MDAAGQSSLAPGPPVSQKDERRGNRDRGPKSKVNKRTKTGCLSVYLLRLFRPKPRPKLNTLILTTFPNLAYYLS